MKKEFLDLGKQPIANKFLDKDEFDGEFFFDLKDLSLWKQNCFFG